MARRARQRAGEVRGRKVGGGIDPLGAEGGIKGLRDKDEERGGKKSKCSSGGVKAGEDEEEAIENRGNEEERTEDLEDGPLPAARVLEPDESWVVIESGADGKGVPDLKRNSSKSKAADGRGGWVDGQGIMYM
jgi:hypothetical protein